jgi:Rap1a immunity proteins
MKITGIDQFPACEMRGRQGSGSMILTARSPHDPNPTLRAFLIIRQFTTSGPRSTAFRGPLNRDASSPMVATWEHTMRRRQKPVLLAAMAAMTVMTVTSVRAQTMANPSESDFQVTVTGDLVRLCEAAPTDATGIAALHFCHGFAVGAYQYHQIAAAAENKPPLFCEPSPRPSRNEAIAGFVSWARQNPGAMSAPPVEGMFRYLAQSYPCRR